MSLQTVAASFTVFAILFIIQIIIARIFVPKSEDRFVITFYVLIPLLLFLILLTLPHINIHIGPTPHELLLIYLLYFVISSSWVATYPALYASSPSLVIIYIMSQQPQGSTLNDFNKWMPIKENSDYRIDDAIRAKLICRNEDGQIRLSKIGRMLFLFFNVYKKALNSNTDTL